MGLPDSRDRLLVALNEVRIGDESASIKEGDIRWLTGPVELSGKNAEKWAVVCEFAKPDEDFLKDRK